MKRMRGRDARAIAFAVLTIAAALALSELTLHDHRVALGITGAYAAVLLTRPRMVRVIRRLRGDTGFDWSGYYRD